jgi:preprotein translocase subunit YajC
VQLSALLLFQNVQPNGPAPGTPGISVQATPAAPAAPPPGGSPFVTLLMLVAFVPFFFLMFRRKKKEQDARAKLKKGDRVVAQGSLVGELVEIDERFAKVKLGPGNTVTVLTASLSPLEMTAAAPKADDKDLKDLKDAKAAADKK